MKMGNVLGYSFTILLLVVMAPIVQHFELWSSAGNWTIPWLCSALALSLSIVFFTSLLSGLAPSQFGIKLVLSVYVPLVIITAVGIAVDSESQGTMGSEVFFVSMTEWLGFAIILLVMFLVPVTAPGKKENTKHCDG